MQWRDTASRYGLVSRGLHWGMALLFAWQFAAMGMRLAFGRSPLTAFMVGSHGGVGTLLLLLVLLRGGWSLLNLRRRPPYGDGWPGWAARTGHFALYGLMVTVPALALLRQYSSGRAFAPFGVPLMAGFEGRVEALIGPANAAHGLLAWTMLVLVSGHIAMALAHRVTGRSDVLARMAGRETRNPARAE
ncbi:cytochrome b [Teichococcus coralli]|uniref:cytochrome b n=1 Tax=Teichococcus coralli TaxID=2545983 RepID=UPI003462D444